MRVKFLNNETRKKFFDSVKRKHSKSWKEIRQDFNLPRRSFDVYKSGKTSVPEKLFFDFLNILNKSDRENILVNIEKLERNHGQIKGGKKAYSINFKKFEEGRKKGLISLKKNKKRKGRKMRKFIFDIKLSSEICEFIGAFIGDGFFNCYLNKNYQIEFSGDSRFDVDYYQYVIVPYIKKIIPSINPRIYFPKSKNAVRFRFYSKEFFCFLRDVFGFVPGRKTHTVKIPKNIMNSPPEFIYSTIRGIFDTDGGVYFDRRKGYKKPYPRIIFQTVSRDLSSQLFEILSKEFKLYSRYNENRNVYVLEIYGHNQLSKWMSLVGFSNPRHLNKIASMA